MRYYISTGIMPQAKGKWMKGKEIVALLKRSGWIIGRIKGSHYQMSKDGKSVTVPVHAGKELGKGLEEAILKQAGLK